jgi:hypothetical protein
MVPDTCLRNENAILHAKIEKLNACKPSTSSVDHVTICTRCRDVNIDDVHDHLALIKQQNDHIAQLTSKINEHEIKNEKFKFARSMLYNGRRPASRMALVSNREAMSNLMPPKDCLILLRVRLPWFKIMRATFYILHKIRRIYAKKSHSVSHHAYMYKNEASSSSHSTHVKMPKKKTPIASNEPNVSFKTFDASYVFTNKSGKVVAKYVGGQDLCLGTQGACF